MRLPQLSLLVALALVFRSEQEPGPPVEAAPAQAEAVASVPWAELERVPEDHVGASRRVVVQFTSLEERWNPFLTRFGPGEYLAVRAWSDEQRTWNPAEYRAPAARFFVERGGHLEALVRGARPHERYEVTLAVREVLAGQVWSEASALRLLPEQVPMGSLVHAGRAEVLRLRGAHELAAGELERALAAPLPDGPRQELEALLEHCRQERATSESARRARSTSIRGLPRLGG